MTILTATTNERMAPHPDDLRATLRGEVVQPGDEQYEEARRVYNAMIDRRPALIARCADANDVIRALAFARAHNLDVAIRSGGHNGAGLGTCDGGMVIDLSPMKAIHVDPEARTARVEGGCTWADIDSATHAHGLATPSGILSTTGVGGLTLGGGHGYLSRKYGLTVDNLLEAEVVLADGRLVRASDDENADLFWALRGGGGNFGIVTAFIFRLHPVTTIVGGVTLWPLEQAREVMRWYRDFIREAPEALSGWLGFHTIPPVEAFPEAFHMQKMCMGVWCFAGPVEEAEAALAPIRNLIPPVLDGIQPMPYPTLQAAFDWVYPPGLQWYWKADFVRDLPDAAIEQHLDFAARLPTLHCTMHLYPINGAVHRVGRNDTAFSYRDVTWSQVIVAVDPDPANIERAQAWAVDYWEALHPYSAGGGYVNFMMEEGQERVQATYRENYERLARIKAKYDPENVFHVNQNIRPVRQAARRAGQSGEASSTPAGPLPTSGEGG
jgi:FAD/FMN-containing dehydrogenase